MPQYAHFWNVLLAIIGVSPVKDVLSKEHGTTVSQLMIKTYTLRVLKKTFKKKFSKIIRLVIHL